MDTALRNLVWQRAESRCEYCGLSQSDSPFRTFHIDHIRARKHGGDDAASNLAQSRRRNVMKIFRSPWLWLVLAVPLAAGFMQRAGLPPAGQAGNNGTTTDRVVTAANSFLATLNDAERGKV